MKADKSILAKIKPFYKYSLDLQTSEPIVSFALKRYFVQQALEIRKTNKAQFSEQMDNTISTILTEAEELKTSLQITDNEVIKQLQDFLKKNFASLIKEEEEAPKIGKDFAAKFQFIRNLIIAYLYFKKDDEEWAQKQKLCEFRIVAISKALKEGKEPERTSFSKKNPPTDTNPTTNIGNNQDTSSNQQKYTNNNFEEDEKKMAPNPNPQFNPNPQNVPNKQMFLNMPPNTNAFNPQFNQNFTPNQFDPNPNPLNFNQFQNKSPGLFSEIQPAPSNFVSQPIQRNQGASLGKTKKDLAYYKRRGEAKRKIEQAIQELDIMNSTKAKASIKEALEILRQLEAKFGN